MEGIEIVPEPEPDERDAILAALAEEGLPPRRGWGRPEPDETDAD